MFKRVQIVGKEGEVLKDSVIEIPDTMNEEGYRFPVHKSGCRLFDEVDFPVELTDTELGKLLRLRRALVGGTNMLGYRYKREIVPYTPGEVLGLLGLCGKRGREFLRKLERLRVIKNIPVDGKGRYYVNPAYMMKQGYRLSCDLFLHFQSELTPLLPRWVVGDFLRQAGEKQGVVVSIIKEGAGEDSERSIERTSADGE